MTVTIYASGDFGGIWEFLYKLPAARKIFPIFLFSVTISLNNRKFVVTTQKKLKYDIGCDNAELPFFTKLKCSIVHNKKIDAPRNVIDMISNIFIFSKDVSAFSA